MSDQTKLTTTMPVRLRSAMTLAANEAGIDGKRIDGFAMIEQGNMSPRIVLQVSSETASEITADEVVRREYCKYCPACKTLCSGRDEPHAAGVTSCSVCGFGFAGVR